MNQLHTQTHWANYSFLMQVMNITLEVLQSSPSDFYILSKILMKKFLIKTMNTSQIFYLHRQSKHYQDSMFLFSSHTTQNGLLTNDLFQDLPAEITDHAHFGKKYESLSN